MGPAELFGLLYAFQLLVYVWNLVLDARQYLAHLRHATRPVGTEQLISESDYTKARNYKLDKHRFGFVSGAFDQLLTAFILFGNWLPFAWEYTAHFSESIYLRSVAFYLVTSIAETLARLPFTLIDTFIIEQKHGFNEQTLSFFALDQLKKLAVSAAISTPLISAIVWIVENGGPNFFVWLWLFVSLFILFMLTVYPEFIAPLFDKYVPLPDGELRQKIEALAKRVEYPLKKLFVVQGSKRSAHSNAYMYGFWKNKRIVLYDTLLSAEEAEKVRLACSAPEPSEEDKKKRAARGMQDDEVVAVLGHELGHWALWHTLSALVIAEVNMLLLFYVFGSFYRSETLYAAFGFTTQRPVFVGLILVAQYCCAPYNELFGFAMTLLSRRREFAADDYSAKLGQAESLSAALIKLGADNLSLPVDDWLYSLFNHSHPPIAERVKVLQKSK